MLAPFALRRALGVLLVAGVALASVQAGCGNADGSGFNDGANASSGSAGAIPPGFGGDGDGAAGSSNGSTGNVGGVLDVTPATVTINVTIANGVVTSSPQTFVAKYNGAPVAATWLFDRGELGDVDGGGVFTASGKNVGEGTVTARFGAREGTAKVKIVINATQNGADAFTADAGAGGAGGAGGVGGDAISSVPVPNDQLDKLRTTGTAPASATELGFLYPYDKTVWPRGLLPPLLMWQTNKDATSVLVKLTQGNYTFEGTYVLSQLTPGSVNRKRIRIEEAPWRTATNGNAGDDLKVEVKIHASNGTVYGPITQTWRVAPGVLKGTVYYNSYDSQITTNGGGETGGVIKIKPRSPNPDLAVPSRKGYCTVCHVVSADGSTLFVQDANYSDGASYDLTQAAPPRTPYLASAKAENNRKFAWSAPYPDGSFALASSRFAREAYTQTASKLFKRSDGGELVSIGFTDAVTSAVTPAFAPDGRKVAFNFWEGPGAGGVSAGAGHSLAVMDFSCGAAPGSTACAASPVYAFSTLREVYRDNTRWPGWPSFVPDGKAIVFHNATAGGNCGPGAVDRNSTQNCQLTTWFSAKSELWIAKDAASSARRLDAANGVGLGLPTNGDHPNDALLNYQPTVNPVASGGYYWVVFTSRRIYGNLLTGKPWGDAGDGGGPIKKLWVAAVDINNPDGAADPSHPAFYLPGQELDAGNTRGFWAVDPCKANGLGCETGDECCNGFCRKDQTSGALVCQDKPAGNQCAQEFEKCTTSADCCDPSFQCIANKCTRPDPVVK